MSHLRGQLSWVTYVWTIRGRWGKLHAVVAACGSAVPGLKNIHGPDFDSSDARTLNLTIYDNTR